MRQLLIGAAVAISIAACSTESTTVVSGTPSPSAASSPTMGMWSEPACPASDEMAHEVQGTASSGITIWGLIFGPGPPFRAATHTKVILRMTGMGEPIIYADGPRGIQIRPDAGWQGHAGSSWDRPGDEWSTFLTFPSGGCWNIRVVRPIGRGSIPLTVSA
jgi:hypothetical protein